MFNWNFFPHTNFNEINLDWILDCLKALTGGDTGKILAKKSANDFDFEWVDDSGGGGGAVDSVNGKTGTVVLNASDVGALPDTYTAPVTSVNGQTGAVSLSIPSAATTAPADLGANAAVGTGTTWARSNHVHKRPTAADIGAIAAPQNPSDGQFLVFDSDLGRWIAYTLPVYNGGVI